MTPNSDTLTPGDAGQAPRSTGSRWHGATQQPYPFRTASRWNGVDMAASMTDKLAKKATAPDGPSADAVEEARRLFEKAKPVKVDHGRPIED